MLNFVLERYPQPVSPWSLELVGELLAWMANRLS